MTDLEQTARDFGDETYELVRKVFGQSPAPLAEEAGDLFAVEIKPIRLTSGSNLIAELHVSRHFCLDSSAQFLAVHRSTYRLVHPDSRRPLFRYEYGRDIHTAPASHIHQHDDHPILSQVHAEAGRRKPGSIWAMHFPTGGARFRPCLEDVLQFLITEFRLDTVPTWRSAIEAGREAWRRIQTRSVVRDAPSDAVAILEELGYAVTPPLNGPARDRAENLRRW